MTKLKSSSDIENVNLNNHSMLKIEKSADEMIQIETNLINEISGNELEEYKELIHDIADDFTYNKSGVSKNTVAESENSIQNDCETISYNEAQETEIEVNILESQDENIELVNNIFGFDISGNQALVSANNIDLSYKGVSVKLSDSDKLLVKKVVQAEAGGEGMIGAALVAQAIKDTLLFGGCTSVQDVIESKSYAPPSNDINENVDLAVDYIFDRGGIAVQHKIYYFYAPAKCSSSFHESKEFVVEYGGHRFFY